MPPLVLGILVWGAAFALLAVWPTTVGALLLLAAAGAGRSLLDVARRTICSGRLPLTCSRASSACSRGCRWPGSHWARS
jgi:hypothetical protein